MTEEEIRQLLTPRERAEGDNDQHRSGECPEQAETDLRQPVRNQDGEPAGQYTKTILTIPLMNERDG